MAERLHAATLKLTVPHDDDELADQYADAFEKVFTSLDQLREGTAA